MQVQMSMITRLLKIVQTWPDFWCLCFHPHYEIIMALTKYLQSCWKFCSILKLIWFLIKFLISYVNIDRCCYYSFSSHTVIKLFINTTKTVVINIFKIRILLNLTFRMFVCIHFQKYNPYGFWEAIYKLRWPKSKSL